MAGVETKVEANGHEEPGESREELSAQTAAKNARRASRQLQALQSSQRVQVLQRIASALDASVNDIVSANSHDLSNAHSTGPPNSRPK